MPLTTAQWRVRSLCLAAGTDIGHRSRASRATTATLPTGYVISGEVIVTYSDRTDDICVDGDLFYLLARAPRSDRPRWPG